MDGSKIHRILDHLCQTVGGDWLLVGGAFVQIELNGERATEDIDLALMAHGSKSDTLAQNELFRFAMKELQIGPESVNLAVAPFLADFPGWEFECKILRSGSSGRVFRPSLALFIALKLGRASKLDLQDILLALEKLPRSEINEVKLKSWLKPEQFQKYLSLLKD